ncbi:hypothetical protein [Ideonella sp. A 288]|uniref:hypothetical protein n=1 Tax=Ideonella sp. A 288 TaxID=1962181 RepID=UPI000B4AFEF1|nr:hypothetical protein [Ideonella sp. A 288]
MCCAIVGVLLSVLLPRLAEWQASTRQVRLQAAMAAVQAAIPQFQARCSREAGRPCDLLRIDGQPIAGAHGHAAASAEGIARLAALSPDLALRPGTRNGVPSLTVAVPSPAATPCEFTYVQAPQAGAAPRIDRDSASCP